MKIEKMTALVLLFVMVFSASALASASQVEQLVAVACRQVNAPYELNSNPPESFNCLTFVSYCINQVDSGRMSPRGISGQYKRITSIDKVKQGDIVCFKAPGRITSLLDYHFGICTGKGYFIHASSGERRVILSKLKAHKKNFMGAARLF